MRLNYERNSLPFYPLLSASRHLGQIKLENKLPVTPLTPSHYPVPVRSREIGFIGSVLRVLEGSGSWT